MVGFQAKRRHPQPADCAGHAEVRVSSVAAKYETLAQNTVHMCLDSRSFVKFFAARASGQVGCGTSMQNSQVVALKGSVLATCEASFDNCMSLSPP